MRFTASEIRDATGGTLFGRDVTVSGVSIDSRLVAPGELFVPIVAERDGHDFIRDALLSGAAAHLTSGPIEAGTAIGVADTAAALSAVGRRARARMTGRVVGITGSVGKTSLKDMLRSVGATTWVTWANQGSFNNELGVPLTLVNAPEDAGLVVVEMGARGAGHIAELCEVAAPSVGVVTVVAGAHLEQFGDVEAVAAAKSELVACLPPGGYAVLNADDPRVIAMAAITEAEVVSFGVGAGEVRAEGVSVDDSLRARFVLRSPWGAAQVHLGVAGAHQVTNALGAAAAALVSGATPAAVAEGLAESTLSAHRMHLLDAPDGFRVLDDSYNANPTSMLAALDALAALSARRRFAVLSTMAELGRDADEAHREVALHAAKLGIEVVTVAEAAYGTSDDRFADDPGGAVEIIESLGVGSGDAVLVKASRSARLERVVDLLVGR